MGELDADHDGLYDNDEGRAEKPAAPFWTVAIYLVDQAYGGPEEGGWWYQCGERQDALLYPLLPGHMLTVHASEENAIEQATILQGLLDKHLNTGRRPISSVLSEGMYNAQVHNGHPPAHYPERKPRYE